MKNSPFKNAPPADSYNFIQLAIIPISAFQASCMLVFLDKPWVNIGLVIFAIFTFTLNVESKMLRYDKQYASLFLITYLGTMGIALTIGWLQIYPLFIILFFCNFFWVFYSYKRYKFLLFQANKE
ncbi:hypothetical protein [Thalassomonas actiniarum]|uniref:Uncharacterized protein n=1 Tax=Thalassomonas actiniarum TaxID=485447 RepID=A0AAF0C5G0_9GAMM|nr:hypothetical protein [Thalassomonas actiniarum]WDE00825.1 hypothetical protein SG35_009430 [Thalassomonas actiniarum]